MSLDPLPAVGFIGAGQMASALAGGWVDAGLIDPERSMASDTVPAARARFEQSTRLKTVPTNADVVAACDVLVLAVKPQVIGPVLAELRPLVSDRHLVVSIAAGITLETLSAGLGSGVRLVRVMPNTPCLVRAGASGYAAGKTATEADRNLVGTLFGAIGKAVAVTEPQLDAVTGLSGSGPAYVYVMIEALADGGVRAGLPRDVALTLAAQTVLGSARMVLETGSHPAALKDAVASPSGTTIAGLFALEQAGFRGAVMAAVEAAAERARELGRHT